MSLYADYLREKTNDLILETEDGFATYRYIEDKRAVYILDIYVVPDKRNDYVASTLADLIRDAAKQKGCTEMWGSVIPSNKNSTISLHVLLSYGFTLGYSTNDFILFKKEI